MKIQLILGIILGLAQFTHACQIQQEGDQLIVTTIYGQTRVIEPVLIELIKSPAMERLKKVRQYGVTWYAHEEAEYTRFTHSIGVFFLLKKYGANLEEQIDGLLHDVSHTVFSHVGDYLFNCRFNQWSYQDEIHEWFLQEIGVTDILNIHGFDDACTKKAKKRHRLLEQDRPDLCADRIEYNLHGGLVEGFLTHDEVNELISALHFENGQWFFDNVQAAKKFGQISIKLSLCRWGSHWNVFVDYCARQALMRALELGLLTKDLIHFGIDDAVWQMLVNNQDSEIQLWVNRIKHFEMSYCLCDEQEADYHLIGKILGTDPLVKMNDGLMRVSSLDSNYEKEFKRATEIAGAGWFIKFLS
ncbi:MAG TPA: hypothetical protein VFF04_00970 [Candidatus Babeliales bacterium]|nr:hypothetical protein [Candidatus Babeliales bacterium]